MAAGIPITVQVGDAVLEVETVPVAGTQGTSRLGDSAEQVRDAFTRAQQAIVEIAASTVQVIEGAAGGPPGRTRWRSSSASASPPRARS